MKIGTKSVLFGAHQFLIHPWFVAAGWWKLFGFPTDPRLWIAFVVHDLGYWGKPNMDGDDGETHVFGGAQIMGTLFDYRDRWRASLFSRTVGYLIARVWGERAPGDLTWYCFSFYHSRFMAKRYSTSVSPLCYADKLAIALTPSWLYVPMVLLTGEAVEYMTRETRQDSANWTPVRDDVWKWHAACRVWCRDWVKEHSSGREDTWTPAR